VFSVAVQLLEEFYPMCYYRQLACGSRKIILSLIMQVKSRYIQLLQVAEASMYSDLPVHVHAQYQYCLKISRIYQNSFCCFIVDNHKSIIICYIFVNYT